MLKNLSSSFPIPFPLFLHGLKTPLHPLYRGDLSSIPYSVGPTHSLPCPALGRTTPPARPATAAAAPSLPPLAPARSRVPPPPPPPPRRASTGSITNASSSPCRTCTYRRRSASVWVQTWDKDSIFFSTNGDESAHRADGSGKRRDDICFSAAARSSFFFVARPVRPRGVLVAPASARRPRPGRRRGSGRRIGWSTAADCRRCWWPAVILIFSDLELVMCWPTFVFVRWMHSFIAMLLPEKL
jgi:hypothetical protein